MSFSAILTAVGQLKAATAATGGAPIDLGEVALGDGNGSAVVVSDARVALVNEVWRGPAIAEVLQHETLPNTRVIHIIIDAAAGGFTMRELGIYDDDGELIVYASLPAIEKPTPASGTAFALNLFIEVTITNADDVTITIATTAYATTTYVDNAISTLVVPFASVPEHLAGEIDDKAAHPLGLKAVIDAHAASRNHPNATPALIGLTRYATAAEIRDGAAVDAAVTPGPLRTEYDVRYVRKAGDLMDAGKNLDFRGGGAPRVLIGGVYRQVWHPGNHGPNSGLNADLLDGIDSTGFVQTSRLVATGWGLTGGGNLGTDRTLAANQVELDARYLGRRVFAYWDPYQSANLTVPGTGLFGELLGKITFATPAPATNYIVTGRAVRWNFPDPNQGPEGQMDYGPPVQVLFSLVGANRTVNDFEVRATQFGRGTNAGSYSDFGDPNPALINLHTGEGWGGGPNPGGRGNTDIVIAEIVVYLP